MTNYIFSLLAIAFFAFGCGANSDAQKANEDGTGSFGAKISADGAIPIAELATKMAGQTTVENLKLEAPIEAVCQKKGCWMDVKNGDQTMKVTFKDYKFFVPKNAPGKTAVMEGKAFVETTSVEDLRHYAVDGGMSAEEAAKKFTEPKQELRFEATGVIIK